MFNLRPTLPAAVLAHPSMTIIKPVNQSKYQHEFCILSPWPPWPPYERPSVWIGCSNTALRQPASDKPTDRFCRLKTVVNAARAKLLLARAAKGKT